MNNYKSPRARMPLFSRVLLQIHGIQHTVAEKMDIRAQILRLSYAQDAEREEIIQQLTSRGDSVVVPLTRALRGSPAVACGAAMVLGRMGTKSGVYRVLLRCYEEEWLSHSIEEAHLSELRAVRLLERELLERVVEEALQNAQSDKNLPECLEKLSVSLCALRILLLQEGKSTLPFWRLSLEFGHYRLLGLIQHPLKGLAHKTTDAIRAAGLRGLRLQQADDANATLMEILTHHDLSVVRTAIQGIQRTRCHEALPILQSIAFGLHHPLSRDARRAIERILGESAEPLLLLRGSVPLDSTIDSEDLLRPLLANTKTDASELLRPME